MTQIFSSFKNNPRIAAVSPFLSENTVFHDFPARMSEWPSVSRFFSSWARENHCPESCSLSMEIALEELFTNTASYGYPDQEGYILILLTAFPEKNCFRITLADNGLPFNPLDYRDPDLTLSVGDMPIGGLGIHMVRKFMDEIEYHRQLGCNVITLQKYNSCQEKGDFQ